MTADESSALTVVKGSSSKPEIISDQNSITGSNFSMPYRELTFFYPEGSTKYGHSWVYTHGARPIPYPNRVFGREEELTIIEKILTDKSALVLTGLHGVGKSTLASMFVNRMGDGWKFGEIYWRKVDETTDITEVIGSFLTDIGKPVQGLGHCKVEDQINLLFQELSSNSYLLIFDNFEVLLNPQTNKPLESKVGFSELIERANQNDIASRFIFISCSDVISEAGDRLFSYRINGLDSPAGIMLLRREGLNKSEDELKKILKLSGGHPFALILLAQLTRKIRGTLSTLLDHSTFWDGGIEQVLENIFNLVYNHRLSEDERKVLQHLSIFRQPVPAEAIAVMAGDLAWTRQRVEEIAWDLCLKSFLQKSGDKYWEAALVSRCAESGLLEESGYKSGQKSGYYGLACKYYLSLPAPVKPEKQEEFRDLIEAHHYACRAGDFNRAVQIISDHNLDGLLDQWGNSAALIDLYLKMLPAENYGNEAFSNKTEVYGVILGNLGNAYRTLGDLRKSVKYSEHALTIIKESSSRSLEGLLLGNLGLSYRKLGELEKAIECSEQALKITKKVKNKGDKGIILGNLGLAYHELGEFGKAAGYYEQALKITKKTGDRGIEGILQGNLGVAHRKLGDYENAIECAQQAVKIARETQNRDEEVVQLGNLAKAYQDSGKVGKAIEYYQAALEIARETKHRRTEGSILMNLSLACQDSGELGEAIEHYEQALLIVKETGDRVEEGVLFGNLGRAYNELGNPDKAIEFYQRALKIAVETENKKEEIVQLGNLGRAYHRLRDPRKTIEYCGKALLIAREFNDRSEEGVLLANLGRAYNDLGNPRKAIECYEQALIIVTEIENYSLEGTLCGNLGLAYRKIGGFGKAIEYYGHALKIARDLDDRYSQGVLLGNLGRIYHLLGEHGKAIEYYEQSLSFEREIGDRSIISFFKKNLDELKYSRNRVSQASSKQNKFREEQQNQTRFNF